MFKELKFVQGAVAKKDFIPAITHFAIQNGTVRAYNGTIALCSPINCDLDCHPKAVPMVQAIARCNETITLNMTPSGRLSIRSGKFRALIECVEEAGAFVQPEGEPVYFRGAEMLEGLKAVYPFIGSDASRPWATGVLLKDSSIFATNNVCLVQYWLGDVFPHVVNLPRAAVQEMIRINEVPTHAAVTENSCSFFYADGRWIRSQLFSTEWPDLGAVLDRASTPREIPEGLFEGLAAIKPFVNKLGQVFLSEGDMRTHQSQDEGANFAVDWNGPDSLYSIEMLSLLEGVAKRADFSLYPGPCTFVSDGPLRGAIIGMRL